MVKDVIYNKLKKFDMSSRDISGNISGSNRLEQFIENIISNKKFRVNDDENYLQYLLRINDDIYTDNYNFLFNYIKDDSKRYITSYLDGNIIKGWTEKNNVFILAGTGKGKNFFVKNALIKNNSKKKIVIFVNRQMLLKQQKEIIEMNAEYSDNIIEGFKTKGIVKINRNIMLISYQQAALSILNDNLEVVNFLSEANYAVFDEVHYLLDDSMFNKGVNLIFNNLIDKRNSSKYLGKAVKIFMSATMEEILVVFKKYGYKFDEKNYFSLLQDKIPLSYKFIPKNYFLNVPTDYMYIEPCMYTDLYDLIDTIIDRNEKWLIFVDSKEVGKKLCDEINHKIGSKEKKEAIFINADNRENENFQAIINNERFEERVLIATSVLYNGVNLKDDDLKNIVLPFVSVPMAKQMIGRKRIENEDKVRVYFKNVDLTTIRQAFTNNVSKYLDIMVIERMDDNHTTGVLNGLIKIRDEFLYFNYDEWRIESTTNNMACEKLHFDSMFLLYILQKITKHPKWSYVRIMLNHLGIGKKYKKMKNYEMKSDKENRTKAREKLIKWLDKYSREENSTFIFEDGNCDELKNFNSSFNDIYYMLYGENATKHHKSGKRTIPENIIKKLIEEFCLPYRISFDDKKGNVKKIYIEKVCEE